MDSEREYLHCPVLCKDVGTQTNGTALDSVSIRKASPKEFLKVSETFESSWAKEGCPSLSFVFVVSNRQLEQKWSAYKQNLLVEELFHGTTLQCNITVSETVCNDKECGICGISQVGFDGKYIGKNSYQRFGAGFYFAPISSKCHEYTQGAHSYRAMLLCDVCVGKKYTMTQADENLLNPPQGYDSIYGKSGSGSVLNYDENVVYNPHAVFPRYIILYQKDETHKFDRDLNHSDLSATIPPLLITFKSGCCPKELFEDLGNCLVNKQVANSALTKDESECHNSQICFTMGLQKLLLKSNDNYIYIELILDEEDRKLSSNLCTLCNIVRKLIEQNITKACKTLGYSSNATYSLSFKCRCSQMEKFHSAELRTDDPLLNRISSCALILTKRQMSVQSVMHGFLSQTYCSIQKSSQ